MLYLFIVNNIIIYYLLFCTLIDKLNLYFNFTIIKVGTTLFFVCYTNKIIILITVY